MSNSTPVTFKTVTFFWVHITTLVIKRVSSFIAHEAAGSYVFGRHIYNCKKKAVFCDTLFYAAATPEGYPRLSSESMHIPSVMPRPSSGLNKTLRLVISPFSRQSDRCQIFLPELQNQLPTRS